MASRIITKKGSGAPLASDLVHGELAVDTVNKRLYTENAGGTVIEVGTAPSTIDINAGTIDGTVIGGSTPAAVTTTALVATTADINGGTIDGTVIGSAVAAAGTFTALSSDYLNETVYELTGTDIDPANGAIQYKTLAANTTFTESLASGDSVILRISGGATYTVTWPTMTWVTSAGNTAPTLGGSDFIVIWQEGATVYGAYIGSYA